MVVPKTNMFLMDASYRAAQSWRARDHFLEASKGDEEANMLGVKLARNPAGRYHTRALSEYTKRMETIHSDPFLIH